MDDLTLTAEYVRSVLIYDVDTGEFTNRVTRAPRSRAGDKSGGVHTHGYIKIRLKGRKRYAHRLAWLYVHGTWPTGYIDHIDGNTSNNRMSNLRVVTHAQNNINRRLRNDNTSGCKGVTWDSQHKKWRVQVRREGARKYQALFLRLEDARTASEAAIKEQHGEFARIK